ncbi:MAG: hypothetical protein ABSG38_04490 [Spirochaetia bacterium]|jgi:hypothetical protein
MIEIRRIKHGLAYEQKWFARRAAPLDALGLVAYLQYLGSRPAGLFVRRPFSTVLIDLSRDPEQIMADMHRNVRSEIRRAGGEGILWSADVDLAEFTSFHASFAREKGIEGVDLPRLRSFGGALLLTRATLAGKTLAQHAYIVDDKESRARFLYSSSGRFESANSALVGRANRWCHWKDMLYLRDLRIRTYDLGGIASGTPDTEDRAGIDEFKLRFGGAVVREDHWLSPLYAFAGLLGVK